MPVRMAPDLHKVPGAKPIWINAHPSSAGSGGKAPRLLGATSVTKPSPHLQLARCLGEHPACNHSDRDIQPTSDITWMKQQSQLARHTGGWVPLPRRAGATSRLRLLFPLLREPFGDSSPGRDAESTSPGEKSCLRLQKAYLQQAVLVTFIKIEHWASPLPCFLVLLAGGCYCKALTPWCAAARWKPRCPRGEDRRAEAAGQISCLRSPRLQLVVTGTRGETCCVTNFRLDLWSSAVLHQVQLEDWWSLVGTFVIISWIWCIPDVEGEDRKSIKRIRLPSPPGGLLTAAQAWLSSIKSILLLQFGASNLITSKGLHQKKKKR